MMTLAQSLAAYAAQIKDDIRVLLGQSRLHPRNQSGDIVIISSKGDYCWEALSVDARRIQTKILKDYTTYRGLVHTLIMGMADDLQKEYTAVDEFIVEHVEQQYSTWCTTPQEVLERICKAFDCIESIVNQLYSSDGMSIVVPDTNALLANPNIDRWTFDWCESFELVFTPTILAELDKLKITHKNPDFRDKAESVIRRIKDLRRRGDLLAGVPVVKNRIKARSVAVEPRMNDSLPWLVSSNNDDRFLASVIELTRDNVRSVVTIVTRDINLQNKAGFARLPFCEPPSEEAGAVQGETACQ